jgi:hypothetical protein
LTKSNNKQSCVPCFCNGLAVDCESSNLVYNKIRSNFEVDDEQWYVANANGEAVKKLNVKVEQDSSKSLNWLTLTEFPKNEDLYLIAPNKYRGNKLASYGGNLSFVLRYDGLTFSDKPKKLDIRISVMIIIL